MSKGCISVEESAFSRSATQLAKLAIIRERIADRHRFLPLGFGLVVVSKDGHKFVLQSEPPNHALPAGKQLGISSQRSDAPGG